MTAALVLLGALAVLLVAVHFRPFFAIGFASGVPLFFRISTEDGIAFGTSVLSPSAGVTLPLIAFASPLLLVPVAGRRLRAASALRTADWLVALFVGWAILAFCATWVLGEAPSAAVLAQLLFPIVAYAAGRLVGERGAFAKLASGMVCGAALTGAWLLVSAVALDLQPVNGPRLGDRLLGGLVIYQVYDYFPFLLVVCFCMAAGLLARTRHIRYAAAMVVLATCVLLLYSRTSAVALILSAGVVGWWARTRVRPSTRLAFIGVAAAVVVGALALDLSSATRLVASIGGRDSTGQVAESNRTRVNSMREAIDLIARDPLLGQGFAPTFTDPATGLATTTRAHNQYLDLAVRGGIPLALLFIVLLVLTFRDGVRQLREPRPPPLLREVLLVLAVAALVSNSVQSTFVQPLTALPLWLLTGMVIGLSTVTSATSRHR